MIRRILLAVIIGCANYSPFAAEQRTDQNNREQLCNGLAGVFTFSSQIRYCKGEGDRTVSCTLLEENVIDGQRGKLVLRHPSSEMTHIYYQADSFPEAIVADEKSYSFFKETLNDRKNGAAYAEVAYSYQGNNRWVIGPSAAILAAQAADRFEYSGPQEHGPIRAYSCSASLDYLTGLRNVRLDVIFQEPSWTKPAKEHKILKLKLSSGSIVQEFEYIRLTPNDETESIWRMPAIGAAPSSPGRKLPQFVGTGMHQMVLELMNEDEDEAKLETTEVYFSRKEGLLRIHDTETDSKLIYNEQARSLYEVSDGICKVSLVDRESRQDLRQIRMLLDDIENSQSLPYNYLGQEMVQQLLCDVFEHRSIGTPDNKIIRTIYVRHKADAEDSSNSFPVRVSEVAYKQLPDGKNKIERKSVFNLLQYQQLYYDQYYRDVFQTKYCHSDGRDNLYLTMQGLSSDFTDQYLTGEQHINQLRDDISQLLRNLTGLSFSQIPELFVEFRPPEIKIETIFEELVRTSDYFEEFTKHWIPLIDIGDDGPTFETEQKCEKNALADKTIFGFTYCEQSSECYLIDNEDLFVNGDKSLVAKPHCFIRRKVLRNSEVNLVLIHEAFGKLKNAINQQQVILRTTLIDQSQAPKAINFKMNSVYESFSSEHLKYRPPFVKHQIRQRISSSFVKHSEKLKTVKDCYLLCRQKNCSHFNVCKDDRPGSELDCGLAVDGELGELLADSQCNLFEAKHLNLFDKYEESRFEKEPLEELLSIGRDECARRCLQNAQCKSIVFYEEATKRSCQLTDQHMENQLNRVDRLKNFTIYSMEYHPISTRPNAKSSKATYLTRKGCALKCIDQPSESSLFNFCPDSKNNVQQELGHCHCMSHETEPILEETPWDCVSFEKNADSFLHPKEKPQTEPSNKINGLTFLNVAEIVFILFFVGILVGGVSFFAKRHLLARSPSRRETSSFFSVRFAKKSIIDEIDE